MQIRVDERGKYVTQQYDVVRMRGDDAEGSWKEMIEEKCEPRVVENEENREI